MTLAPLVLLLTTLAAAGAAPTEADRAEYARRIGEIDGWIVYQRVSIAAELRSRGAYEWARVEYRKILWRDPANTIAREALGMRIEQGVWVQRPGEGIPIVDREVSAEARENRLAYYERELAQLATAAAERHRGLAVWCRDAELTEEARGQWLETLAYDPRDAAAVRALGFRQSELLPLPGDPTVVEVLQAWRHRAGSVGLGELQEAERAWVPETVRARLTAVAVGEHVGVATEWMPEEWVQELCRWGDHSYELAHQLLDCPPPATGEAPSPAQRSAAAAGGTTEQREPRYWFLYVDQGSYEEFTEWTLPGQPREAYEYLLRGTSQRNDSEAFRASRWRAEQTPNEDLAHLLPQFVLTRRLWNGRDEPRGKAALMEGFGVFCEFMGRGTNRVWCVGQPSTSNEGRRENYRLYSADAARALADLNAVALFQANFETIHNGSGATKAASVMEWLFARGQDQAMAFIRAMAVEDVDVAAVIAEHFGWCPEEFDEHWRRWAIQIVEAESQDDTRGRRNQRR